MYSLHINGWTPSAVAIAIALREKELEFAIVEHDWQTSADALGDFSDRCELLNTLEGEFPLLVADGTAISDSYFILEFIDDRHPSPPLKPADAYGQWQVQALDRFLGERASPAVSSLGVSRQFAGQEWPARTVSRFTEATIITPERRDAWKTAFTDPANAEIIVESKRKLVLLFERLDKTLSESRGKWLLGEQFTITDIAAFVLVDPFLSGALKAAEVLPSEALRDWHGWVSERPAVAGVLAGLELTFLPGPEHSRWG